MSKYRALALARTLAVSALCLFSFAATADPPGRVGRVAWAEGEVALLPAAGEPGIASPVNYPLITGAELRSGRDGRAEVEIGGVTLWLANGSALRLSQLDDDALSIDLPVGTMIARAGDPGDDRPLQITAAGASIEIRRAGRYRVDTDGIAATVSVRDGLARVAAGNELAYVTTGQVVRVAGGRVQYLPPLAASTVDSVDRWVLEREHNRGPDHDPERSPTAVSPRYVSTEMPGWQDLDAYGSWQQNDEFGAVWTPDWVPVGWAPYRNGRWVWLNPWGWTWIDYAPWGFAPFHFGRWSQILGRWCWVPGEFVRRPVFAPALVTFVANGTTAASPGRHPPQGWAPLAPRETFVPAFRASARFVDRINAAHFRWQRQAGGALPRHEFSPGANAITVRGTELTIPQWRFHRRAEAAVLGSRPAPTNTLLPPALPVPAPSVRRDAAATAVAPAVVIADPERRHRHEFFRRFAAPLDRRGELAPTVSPPTVPAPAAVPAPRPDAPVPRSMNAGGASAPPPSSGDPHPPRPPRVGPWAPGGSFGPRLSPPAAVFERRHHDGLPAGGASPAASERPTVSEDERRWRERRRAPAPARGAP